MPAESRMMDAVISSLQPVGWGEPANPNTRPSHDRSAIVSPCVRRRGERWSGWIHPFVLPGSAIMDVVNSADCQQSKKCVRARATRRLLEQRRQERPLGEPQRERARQRQPGRRFPLCPELDRQRVSKHPGMDLPLPMDQALFPVVGAAGRLPKLEGSRGVGSGGAAAPSRQLPGKPLSGNGQ